MTRGTVANVVGVAMVAGAVSVRADPELREITAIPDTTAPAALALNSVTPERVGTVVAFTMIAA
jgi:hypothetical protein